MALLEHPVESISEATLKGLIAAGVGESKYIEYKRELPGRADGEKKEFLFDLSSFANADGGDILYGVEATNGVPTSVVGFEKPGVDAQILRCEQLVQAGIAPRIPGLRFVPIDIASGRIVLLARIPKTWAGPHMVVFQSTNKFYSRNSAGKYLLNINELRSSFLAGASLGEKMRAFRLDRVNAILNGSLSVPLPSNPKTVLHVLPVISFRPGYQVDLRKIASTGQQWTRPMRANSWGTHYNFDGLISSGSDGDRNRTAYIQIFRNGCLEATESTLLRQRDNAKYFPGVAFEQAVVECGTRLLKLLETMETSGPYIVMLSYLGVRGYVIYVDPFRFNCHGAHQIERDNLFPDEILMEGASLDFGKAMRPIFDQVWNACGWPASLNYDEQGNWRAHAG